MLRLDPVIPHELDGLRVQTTLRGRPMELTYRIATAGSGVRAVELNGQPVEFVSGANPHRTGAAQVAMAAFVERLNPDRNALTVTIG